MRGRPCSGWRRRFKGEITYYFRFMIKLRLNGVGRGGYRLIDGYAEREIAPDGKITHGEAKTKTACRDHAGQQNKRAVFIERGALLLEELASEPKTPLERAEELLGEEKLKLVREMWDGLQEALSGTRRAQAFIQVQDFFETEAVEAVKSLYAATAVRDYEAVSGAKKRAVAVGAALAWLRMKAETAK